MLMPIPMVLFFLYGLFFAFTLFLIIGSIVCFYEALKSFFTKKFLKGFFYVILGIVLLVAFQLLYVH